MRRLVRSFALPTILVLVAPLAACDDNDDDIIIDENLATLRFVNASTDLGAVDVFAAGVATPLFTDVAFGEVTPFVTIDDRVDVLEVRATGQPTSAPLVIADVNLREDRAFTAIATGTVAAADLRVLNFEEDFGQAGANEVRVRIVNASNVPQLGVDINADNPANPDFTLPAGQATDVQGIALPTNQALRVAFVDNGATLTAFTVPSLVGGAEAFVIAIGEPTLSANQTIGFALLAAGVGPAATSARIVGDPTVFVMHAVADAGPVDVIDATTGAVLISNLAFGQIAPVTLAPGSHTVALVAAGAPAGTAPVATGQLIDLQAGQRFLAIAGGLLNPATGEAGFTVIQARDELTPDGANARVAVINASPDAGALDVGTATGLSMNTPLLVEDLAFANEAGATGIQVAPGPINIGVARAGSPNAIATFPVTATAGQRAFVVATGMVTPTAGQQPFGLTVADTSVWPWVSAPAPEVTP